MDRSAHTSGTDETLSVYPLKDTHTHIKQAKRIAQSEAGRLVSRCYSEHYYDQGLEQAESGRADAKS